MPNVHDCLVSLALRLGSVFRIHSTMPSTMLSRGRGAFLVLCPSPPRRQIGGERHCRNLVSHRAILSANLHCAAVAEYISPLRTDISLTSASRQSGSEIKDREEDVSLDATDFEQAVEKYHLALDDFMKGNPAPAKELFSQRDDVTLGNPFGPFARGWKQVAQTIEKAASHYRDGDATGFENIAKCVTSELAYLVEVELLRSKVGGRSDVTPLALRVTSVFRPEEGLWKIVHRHADPITTVQSAESVIRRESRS